MSLTILLALDSILLVFQDALGDNHKDTASGLNKGVVSDASASGNIRV